VLDGTEASDSPDTVQKGIPSLARIGRFHTAMAKAGLGEGYEARHARLVLESAAVIPARKALLKAEAVHVLPEASEEAAGQLYEDTARKLAEGIAGVLDSYADAKGPEKKRIYQTWLACAE